MNNPHHLHDIGPLRSSTLDRALTDVALQRRISGLTIESDAAYRNGNAKRGHRLRVLADKAAAELRTRGPK